MDNIDVDCFDCKYFKMQLFLCEKPGNSHFVLSVEDAKYCDYFTDIKTQQNYKNEMEGFNE